MHTYFGKALLVTFVLVLGVTQLLASSGNTDSASIRSIESEVRRVKASSDGILAELKKQKDATLSVQNEFKWLHNELKNFKKSLSDIELMVNKTASDSQFTREKLVELSVPIVVPVPISTNITSKANTTTPPSSGKGFFKLF